MLCFPMNRKYAPNRIRELRKARGITMEQLGADMSPEITLATVQKLETGQMGLTLDYINDIARVLGVAPQEIIAGVGGSARVVPLLGAIAAGNWADEIEITDEYVVAPRDAGGVRTFALRPMGDSMNKLVPEDGYICVDPDDVDLIDGKTYAIRSDMGEATFKRFHASPPRLEPCSTNPSHVTIPLGRVPFTVIGRVTYAFAPL